MTTTNPCSDFRMTTDCCSLRVKKLTPIGAKPRISLAILLLEAECNLLLDKEKKGGSASQTLGAAGTRNLE